MLETQSFLVVGTLSHFRCDLALMKTSCWHAVTIAEG